jgi:2-polyprenyl-6-methoxyphenol hydroxylase-like FAD-dependent oxidoreductase
MQSIKNKKVLVSGASMAGLSTAFWLNKIGYTVTVVEMANKPRINGAAVDLRGDTVDIIKRMGIYEQLKANKLHVEMVEFKNANDVTEGSINLNKNDEEPADDDIEIERDKFVGVLMTKLKNDIEFMFNNSITALNETPNDIIATFKDGSQHTFDLVFGCDGIHSGVRKIWFGHEAEYSHFLGAYFSITIVNKLLIKQKTMQLYNVPGKAITLNAYNNKTDIIFCFLAEKEMVYDYKDEALQRAIIAKQFAGQSWRTAELLKAMQQADNFYFDKFCQIKMPSWTKGRVALVGDAGYCASPAAGMGASLSVKGAATVADALQKHDGNFELAFQDYNQHLRPFIEEVQAKVERNVRDNFIPKTEEAIRKRNAETKAF